MTEKFHLTVWLLIILILSASICCWCMHLYMHFYYPPKPKDTNLKFWVGEIISKEEREAYGMTKLPRPGRFGGGVDYLDSDYEAVLITTDYVIEGYYFPSEPETYITYNFDNYPDLSSRNTCLTGIRFNDPNIYLFGLTINSTREEVDEHLLSIGFKIVYYELDINEYNYETRQWELVHYAEHTGTYQRDNLFVRFTEDFVFVGLRSTNKRGIVY